MEWIALFVPVIFGLSALLLWKKKLVWWEVIAPIIIVIIVIMSMKFFMIKNLTSDTEYYSDYVTKITHYDHWNEYIHKKCSYTTSHGSGKHRYTATHYYDCSYVDDHPEYWEATLSNGSTITISKQKYQSFKRLWNNTSFVEMNRHFHTIDGDAQESIFDHQFMHLDAYDSSGSYDNKPQTAETVFHFKELDSIECKKVYNYPAVINSKQNACLGGTVYDNSILRKINGQYGVKYQIKIFVLIFKNRPESVAELQRNHWKNGNKNELVICVDSKSRWTKSFSWSDDKRLEAQSNQLFMNENLTIRQKLIELHKLIPKLWKRKHFEDFDYIDVQLTTTQLIWIYVITFILSIGILWWGIVNEFEDDQRDKYSRYTTSNKIPWI